MSPQRHPHPQPHPHRSRATTTAAAAGLAAALALTGCVGQSKGSGSANRNAKAKSITLTVTANAVKGGKNASEAAMIQDWAIPRFVAAQKKKGVTAHVRYVGSGAEDDQYKTKLSLDMKAGGGADIMDIDGIWIGEFAQAGQIKPLEDVVGAKAMNAWPGWQQVPAGIKKVASFDGKVYGTPKGTDGRILYFNKTLFAKAGLPATWQPHSWQDILDAAAKLKKLPGVTPVQINAGTAMSEATTMQGFLPLLAGTGHDIYSGGKWQGDTPAVRQVLTFYQKLYGPAKLGDPLLQEEAKGRDKSFAEFSANKIGILAESDYLWRGVLDPKLGVAKMADRDTAVGWAFIPAMSPGTGVGGQDYVSLSGGGLRVINPKTKYPAQAWELLQLINSAPAVKNELGDEARITQRQDVNSQVLGGDPLLSFITGKVMPITRYRPPLAEYNQVSTAIQEATGQIVAGKSVDAAAKAYAKALATAVGGASHVDNG